MRRRVSVAKDDVAEVAIRCKQKEYSGDCPFKYCHIGDTR